MPAPPPSNPPNPIQPDANPFYSAVLNNSLTFTSSSSSTTTPARNASRGSGPEQMAFSATQRSLQARGKAYDTEPGEKNVAAESYQQRQRRNEAIAILESVEMLMWYAASRNESIPQTRRHFQNIIFGFADSEPVLWRDEWEVPAEERVGYDPFLSPDSKGKGKERERERDADKGKGKKRMSVG